MTTGEPRTATEIESMRRSAAAAQGRAASARDLALAIDRRRHVVLSRDDEAHRSHTAAVWSSLAATESRVELQSGVGRSLWLVSEDLRATCGALEARASELDATARSLTTRVAEAEVALAAEVALPVEVPLPTP